MSLTGNQLYQTMAQKKIKWATVDDQNNSNRHYQPDIASLDSVELQQ